ncbi:MAG: hypothetical protein ABR616_18785 [Dermatophilaceae bacterium]|nr:hypothetical protein [Intrasporangiaceae bacterium]
MTQKKIVRRRPRPAPEKVAPPKKSKPEYTEIAHLTEDGDSATCSCGKVSVELDGTDAVIRGQHGWIREGQWVTCGLALPGANGCSESIRLSPRLVWETSSGRAYTLGMFLKPDEDERRVR